MLTLLTLAGLAFMLACGVAVIAVHRLGMTGDLPPLAARVLYGALMAYLACTLFADLPWPVHVAFGLMWGFGAFRTLLVETGMVTPIGERTRRSLAGLLALIVTAGIVQTAISAPASADMEERFYQHLTTSDSKFDELQKEVDDPEQQKMNVHLQEQIDALVASDKRLKQLLDQAMSQNDLDATRLSALEAAAKDGKDVANNTTHTSTDEKDRPKISKALAKELTDAGFDPDEVTVGTIDWSRNPHDHTDGAYGGRVETRNELSKLFEDDSEKNESEAWRQVKRDIPKNEHTRGQAGKGYVPIQIWVDSCYEGNLVIVGGKSVTGGKVCAKAGDVFWVYIDQEGKVRWGATVRADCANPKLKQAPRPEEPRKERQRDKEEDKPNAGNPPSDEPTAPNAGNPPTSTPTAEPEEPNEETPEPEPSEEPEPEPTEPTQPPDNCPDQPGYQPPSENCDKGDDGAHNGGSPVTETAEPETDDDPPAQQVPGGGGVVDSPTNAPGSDAGVPSDGAGPAPTTPRDNNTNEDGGATSNGGTISDG